MLLTVESLRAMGYFCSDEHIIDFAVGYPEQGMSLDDLLNHEIPPEHKVWIAIRVLPSPMVAAFAVQCMLRFLRAVERHGYKVHPVCWLVADLTAAASREGTEDAEEAAIIVHFATQAAFAEGDHYIQVADLRRLVAETAVA